MLDSASLDPLLLPDEANTVTETSDVKTYDDGQCLKISHVYNKASVAFRQLQSLDISGYHSGDYPYDGGGKHLGKEGTFLPDYTTQKPTSQPS
jgi:hypothetical protein